MASSPEYRWNPFEQTWVIVAASRADRPYEFPPRPRPGRTGACPFCAGHESDTPPPVAEYRSAGSVRTWQVRVVPNKYPALEVSGGSGAGAEPEALGSGQLFGRQAAARGRHEVIIESPRHVVDWHELSDTDVALVLQAYRDRLRAAGDAGFSYALVFKNVLPEAGASMEHAHSQFMALHNVPPRIAALAKRVEQYYRESSECLTCAWLQWEIEEGRRIVWEDDRFLAICPHFARVPGETWILPRSHESHFGDTSDGDLETLSVLLRRTICVLRDRLPCDAYNLVLQTPPLQDASTAASHWLIQLLPRQVALAGFEWATGCYINTLAPEDAAKRLRSP